MHVVGGCAVKRFRRSADGESVKRESSPAPVELKFPGASAVVLGCNGMTESMCRLLLEQGAAHVGIIGGDVESLCATRERLADPRIMPFHANLAHREQVHAALDRFRAKAGKLDLIVNASSLLAA
jgi:NAD(P)-dependent dehydrogenase (short-subunit alcohol dehydrogenase family)